MILQPDRITVVASRLGIDLTPPGAIPVLLHGSSCDVQAAPGSGKTTLLVAKLAVVLEHEERTVCVLSHTNAARHEIERRFVGTGLERVLQYPSFVGTIQAFVDRFLALPYMRAKSMRVDQIDDEAFSDVAQKEFQKPAYAKARYLVTKNARLKDAHRYLEWGATSGALKSGKRALPAVTTPSYQQFKLLKDTIAASGLYRYKDMFYFANRYLDEYPEAVQALRKRFRLVFIDEMQDTDGVQTALLERMFPQDKVVIQRFGDANQAIYGAEGDDAEGGSFPRNPTLELGASQRFGDFVAGTLSTIAPNRQLLFGNRDSALNMAAPYTTFVFDDDSIKDVVPAFSDLVKSHFVERTDIKAYAVGFRRTAGGGELPRVIGDYLAQAPATSIQAIQGESGLRLSMERARLVYHRDGLHDAVRAARRAVQTWLVEWSDKTKAKSAMSSVRSHSEWRAELGKVLLALVRSPVSQSDYENYVRALEAIFAPMLGRPTQAGQRWARWSVLVGTADDAVPSRRAYVHNEGLVVSLDTIHAVKGQTHDATLVLETYNRVHDVGSVLPYLAKIKALPKNPSSAEAARLRRMFVAMSRPRYLLCLAVHAKHITPKVASALEAQGWRVRSLVKNAGPTHG